MIITKQKPFTNILKACGTAKTLFIFGCGDCATLCRTGGQREIEEMTQNLKNHGIAVSGDSVVPAICHELDAQRVLRQKKKEVAAAEAILVLACGAGIQAVGDSQEKPVISGCDSLFIGNSRRQMHFYEKCSVCGDCILNETGGLCPETRCPKALLNGPCGGASGGMCEVNAENKCVWIEIYQRLKSFGRLEELEDIKGPKNRSLSVKPHKIEDPQRAKRP